MNMNFAIPKMSATRIYTKPKSERSSAPTKAAPKYPAKSVRCESCAYTNPITVEPCVTGSAQCAEKMKTRSKRRQRFCDGRT